MLQFNFVGDSGYNLKNQFFFLFLVFVLLQLIAKVVCWYFQP